MASKLADRKYISYDPSFSKVTEEEAKDAQTIRDIFTSVIAGDAKKNGHAYPVTHAKTLSVVKGRLIVPDDLPAHLKQGPFAQGGQYDVVMRYSFNNHDSSADSSKSLSRGIAMKIFGFPGERFPEGTGNMTQDFGMNSQIPVSELADSKTAAEIITILQKAQTDPQGALQDILKRPDRALQIAPSQQKKRRVEVMTMYSQFAYRFGDYIAKHGIFPVADAQLKLVDELFPADKGTTAELSAAIGQYYSENDAVYEWRFQLLENLDDQPVEYAGKIWDADKYPYQTVAKFVFPKQEANNEKLKLFWVDSLQMNSWRGAKALEPLGSSCRVRRGMYPFAQGIRHGVNKSTFVDAQKIEDIPGPIPC